MAKPYTATSVRTLVDKYFSLQWCRDNLVVPLYIETSLPMQPGIIKIAIANYSFLGTIAEPIKQRLSQTGENLKCEYIERSQEEIQEILDEADPLTKETADVDAVGNSDVTPIGRFPFWNVAETDVVTEAVGGHFFDNGGGELNSNPELSQVDSLTGETTTTENIGGMSGRVTFTGGTGTLQSWRNGQLVTGDTYANPADNNWAFENNTDSICEPETLSPVEFDVAAPLLTDQAVMGDQLKADPSGFCEDLRWVLPEQDLPFGCN